MEIKRFSTALARAPKLDFVPVRTVSESAEGWRLAEERKDAGGTRWWVYVLLTSTATVAAAYAATRGVSALL